MAIGNIPSQAQLNSQIAQLASQWRSVAQQSLYFGTYINNIGTAGLQALSFTSGDATTFVAQADYMLTLSGVYMGTATQGTVFNFENALVTVTGPN
jgi:hypothetical protein